MTNSLSLLFVFTCTLVCATPSYAKVALVYKGPGSCEDGCSEASADVARLAGLTPVFIGPNEKNMAIFNDAVVWLQPGGKSNTVAKNMNSALKNGLKKFIADGGGYVGFCAGGFLATEIIGDTDSKGLGIIPGRSSLLEVKGNPEAAILNTEWNGVTRGLYFEGGPFFAPKKGHPRPEVTAYYDNGSWASVRSYYGKGRVYVTGVHPEAPEDWRTYFKLIDPDGLDQDVAVEMVHWAIGYGKQ